MDKVFSKFEDVSKDKLIKLRDVADDYLEECLAEYLSAKLWLKEIDEELKKRG